MRARPFTHGTPMPRYRAAPAARRPRPPPARPVASYAESSDGEAPRPERYSGEDGFVVGDGDWGARKKPRAAAEEDPPDRGSARMRKLTQQRAASSESSAANDDDGASAASAGRWSETPMGEDRACLGCGEPRPWFVFARPGDAMCALHGRYVRCAECLALKSAAHFDNAQLAAMLVCEAVCRSH